MADQTLPLASQEVYFEWADEMRAETKGRYFGRVNLFEDRVVVSGNAYNTGGMGCSLAGVGVIGGVIGALFSRLFRRSFDQLLTQSAEIVFSHATGQAQYSTNPVSFWFEAEPGKWLSCQPPIRPGTTCEHFIHVLEQLYDDRLVRE